MTAPRRIEKINMLLKEVLAGIIDREVEFPQGSLVTLTRVSVSSDGRYASAFFSAFGVSQDAMLELLKKNMYTIQQLINKKLRMRPVPQIHFALDEDEMRREGVEKAVSHV